MAPFLHLFFQLTQPQLPSDAIFVSLVASPLNEKHKVAYDENI